MQHPYDAPTMERLQHSYHLMIFIMLTFFMYSTSNSASLWQVNDFKLFRISHLFISLSNIFSSIIDWKNFIEIQGYDLILKIMNWYLLLLFVDDVIMFRRGQEFCNGGMLTGFHIFRYDDIYYNPELHSP